jgi:hypothetical protein
VATPVHGLPIGRADVDLSYNVANPRFLGLPAAPLFHEDFLRKAWGTTMPDEP